MNEYIKNSPLADRMRPKNLKDFLGQDDIVGSGKLLREAVELDKVPSMIFWGPPGSGKTTLAFIISEKTKSQFKKISAVSSGLKDLRDVISGAEESRRLGESTILFIDEIHRWNKAQQDALLPYIENGTIVLIGATTENPSFEVRSAILSRVRVFVLSGLSTDNIISILSKAIKDVKIGLGGLNIKITDDGIKKIAIGSNGDARTALNVLEYASSINNEIKDDVIDEAFQKSYLRYDKDGDEHYNIISALHKSMRGSDPDASIYWLARMLESGEDPLYIARRIVRFASEDIGIANSQALTQAVSAYQACHFIGMPECNVILAQAVVYMAKSKKSNEVYSAYEKAVNDVRGHGSLPVPAHIRNASTKLTKDLGYGKDYKYSPEHNYNEEQEYFPEELSGRKYFKSVLK